jgi:hypothetical protein
MIPDNLPPMPLGLYYTGFRSIGIIQNEDGSDGLTLSGRVWLPRCSKCEIRQNKINMVAGILSIIVVIACFIGLIFGTDLSSASGVKDAIIFSCLSPLIIFFTFAASRGVLARIAGAQGIHRLYKEFPPVAKLLENGWVL